MNGQGRQAKILSNAQVRAALGHVDSSSRYPELDRVMILLSVKAGLRAKEIASLTWSMVTDAQGVLVQFEFSPNGTAVYELTRANCKSLSNKLHALLSEKPDAQLTRQ